MIATKERLVKRSRSSRIPINLLPIIPPKDNKKITNPINEAHIIPVDIFRSLNIPSKIIGPIRAVPAKLTLANIAI